MAAIPVSIRERVIKAYESGLSGTYKETARLFRVGEASVSRWLGKARAGESLVPRWGGGPRRRIDLAWLRQHVDENDDARIVDRIDAWEACSGVRVSVGTMWNALQAIGVTHKKRRR
jgi:transposase